MKRSVRLVVVLVALAAPTVASGQGGDGYLFNRPRFSATFRAGYAIPTAQGQLFDFATDEFIALGADTLSSLSFDGPYLGGEVSVKPWAHLDIALGIGWTRSRALTEYRRWIDADDNPIVQETTFEVIYGTLGAKYYPLDRGRSVGSLAWVPRRLTPYVGAGLGLSSYRFVQEGDFVDDVTFAIFPDYLESSDEGLILYGGAGVDMTLFKNAIATVEARYSYSSADVQGSYLSFNDVEIGGLQLMVGLGFQF